MAASFSAVSCNEIIQSRLLHFSGFLFLRRLRIIFYSFLSVVRKYTEIEELTPAIVHEFIDRIIIHDPEQARGNRRQKVEIIYNNIGAVDLQIA
jgi:hypothetical protein